MSSDPQDLGDDQDVINDRSAGTRTGLAAAWLAFQMVRLMFLPFIVIGAGMRYAESQSQKAESGKRQFYVKPASSGTRDL